MSQYSQRPRNWEWQARFQEEEDVYALPNARRENIGLGLKERLPLPSSPGPPSYPASPIPPANRSRGPSSLQQRQSSSSQPRSRPSPQQQSSSQSRARDPPLYSYESANAGRLLTNSSAGRVRPGPQPMPQTRAQYQPLDRGSSQRGEYDSGVLYGNRGYPSGPQPRFNRPADYGEDINSEGLMVSSTTGDHPDMMHSPRSILIGFDDPVPVDSPNMNPTPLAPMPQTQQRKSTNTAPQPTQRGVSPYYSRPATQVPPIPEESRHGSYASSHVIPSTRGSIDYPTVSLSPSMYGGGGEEDDEHKGLVRQASLGRKSKPKITEIKSLSRQDSTKQTFFNSESPPPGSRDSPLPTRDASPPNTAIPAVPTPSSMKVPPPHTGFSFPSAGSSDSDLKEVGASGKELGVDYAPHSRASSMYSHTMESLNTTKSMAARMNGRKAPPPGLNLNAVRDAEARGSLTSLPDLIRRATKLAAVLETGKPRVGSSLRGSNRRTDSISDILGSFPPLVSGAGGTMRSGRNGSRTSAWPLPSDFMDGNGSGEGSSVQSTSKKDRKVCCLPLWAFILLVILALLVTATAVIVPLQLVTLSRSQENHPQTSSDAEILQQCKIKNPCANGGKNVATKDFCGCVCTGGFSGKTCTKLDNSCVTMDLEGVKSLGNTLVGIQNATMGSAIRRLLEISTPKYNVQLDGSRVLSAFWASEVSCTQQNALVTFNGKTVPDNSTSTTSTTAPSVVPTATPAPVKRRIKRQNELKDEDAVDFSRVAVLFLVQDKGLNVAVTAQKNLQSKFALGVDSGTVDAGNQVSVDLDKRVLNLPGGITVGGPKSSS